MNNEKIINLYKKIYLIKKVEDTIIDNYSDDGMKTPMHMSKGSEYIAVGVCSALGNRGQFFGTYRTHSIYFACGGDLNQFFSEMYGKENGAFMGKSGSMHISSPDNGFLSSSAIVASNIPVAVGAAFANKFKMNDKIAVVFFGDGAMDEGNFWESINMACLWRLPVIFVCEDNHFAVHTYKGKRQGYENILDVIGEFNIQTFSYDGSDVEEVYKVAQAAMHCIDIVNKPCFIKFDYYRELEHVGVLSDIKEPYRLDDVHGKRSDYMSTLSQKLIDLGIDVDSIEKNINNLVFMSLKQAKESKFSDSVELYKEVFCD